MRATPPRTVRRRSFSGTKSAVDEAVAELLCPITHSLPVDPVTAEDGNIYERSAIEEWLKGQQRSPLTNVAMGAKLLVIGSFDNWWAKAGGNGRPVSPKVAVEA